MERELQSVALAAKTEVAERITCEKARTGPKSMLEIGNGWIVVGF
jgi:hypothetical protein